MKRFLYLCFIFLCFVFSSISVQAREVINIAFTIDNNYAVPVLLTVNSILENNDSNSDYRFFIVETNLTEKNKQKIYDFVNKRGYKVEFINVNTNFFDKGISFYDEKQWQGRINNIAISRILLPKILPQNIDKVLYLDADILVLRDLIDLWNQDITNYYAGMVVDCALPKYDFVDFGDKYYNSGVILIDLKKWREAQITEKMLRYIESNFKRFIPCDDKESFFNFADQDLINVVLSGKIKEMPKYFNAFGHYWIKTNEEKVYIIHYIGENKPWLVFRDSILYKEYYDYWGKSELRHYYYYYKYVLKIKESFKQAKKYPLDTLGKLLFIPIFLCFEICFFLLPLLIPLFIGTYIFSTVKKDFQKYKKISKIMLYVITAGIFSLCLDYIRREFFCADLYQKVKIIAAILIYLNINMLIHYLYKKNLDKRAIFLFFALIFYALYFIICIWK